jgi:hypothetical protein
MHGIKVLMAKNYIGNLSEEADKRLDERIHTMYVDKLDGLVDAAFFEKCRTSGARSRIAACARSGATRTLTNPI